MTKTQTRPFPSGVFLPGDDVAAYFDRHGDMGAVFDRVHAHFFESLDLNIPCMPYPPRKRQTGT